MMRSSVCRVLMPLVVGVSLLSVMSSDVAASALYNASISSSLYGHLNQNTLFSYKNYEDAIKKGNYGFIDYGSFACGPTAVANTFAYLQNQFFSIYSNKLVLPDTTDVNLDGSKDNDGLRATVCMLSEGSNYLCTRNRYTTYHDDLIWGVNKYIEQKVVGKTAYSAQDHWGWTQSARPKPSFVSGMNPTWNFIYNSLLKKAGLNILLTWADGGHYVTVNGFHWNDMNTDGIIQQSENAYLDIINPWNGKDERTSIWDDSGSIACNYQTGSWISTAFSYAPNTVPEPASCIGILVGIAGIAGGYVRKRK